MLLGFFFLQTQPDLTHLCIGVEKHLAFGCQLVNIGWFSHLVSIAAQWRPQVICHDEENISPLWNQTKRYLNMWFFCCFTV